MCSIWGMSTKVHMSMEARGVQLFGTRVRDCCELPDVGTWELNLCPLQEQYVFLTTEQSTVVFKY